MIYDKSCNHHWSSKTWSEESEGGWSRVRDGQALRESLMSEQKEDRKLWLGWHRGVLDIHIKIVHNKMASKTT